MVVKRGEMEGLATSAEISEEEAALYDRQIRLWGLESQKLLREANILVIGMGGLAAEVCKNMALAGVKCITLLDSKLVDAKDFSAQFLIDLESALGKNRAEASEAAIRRLNPNVEVKSDTGDVNLKDEEYFSQFDVICATDCPKNILMKIDDICRRHNLKFLAGDVFGLYGYCFLDLANHDFRETQVKNVAQNVVKDEIEPPAKKAKTFQQESETVPKSLEFISLEKALSVKLGKTGTGLRKRTSSVFFLVHIIMKFREKLNRLPATEQFISDVKELKKIRDEIMPNIGFDSTKVSDDLLSSIFGELSPVCAVVGGVLAQEIVKAVSKQDLPIQNFFLFDGDSCCGVTENVGK